MKFPTLLLAGSLAANAVLVVVSVVRAPHNPAGLNFAPAPIPVASGRATDGRPPKNAAAAPVGAAANSSLSPQSWAALQTSDVRTLADRLRAAGFPSAVIRGIVATAITEQFSARRQALTPPLQPASFWKTNSSPYDESIALTKISNAQRGLNQEIRALYQEALGPDAAADSDAARAVYSRTYGDLPMEKIEALQGTLSDYSQMQAEIQAGTRGILLPEDREKLALLEQQKQADLAKVLTPEELEEYSLRSSPTASELRSRLSTFNPTEEEYRAIYKVQAAFDQQYGTAYSGNMTPDQQSERRTHQAELDAQIQAVLSPDRVADYKQAADPAYQQINRLLTRLELPPVAAVEVVSVQKDIQQRAAALRTDRTLSASDRNQQLAALANEATTKLTTTLGERGLEAYKSYGGTWIQNLQPRPAPAPARR